MGRPSSSTQRQVTRYISDACQQDNDRLAVEEPLEIRIGTEPLAITMRTPGHDIDLAAGFCLTEGIVEDGSELESVEPCTLTDYGNIVVVTLTEETAARRQKQIEGGRREMYLSSSCGLCGKQSIDRLEKMIRPIRGQFTISRNTLASMPDRMSDSQATFAQTGGLHAAALFDPEDCKLKVIREDVGRHNAVDKVIGHQVLIGRLPIDPRILMVSGRSSFEIMQKAAVAGIAMVAAVSAPSSLAVDFAIQTGMTLVGFLRPGRMNVYNDVNRIVD